MKKTSFSNQNQDRGMVYLELIVVFPLFLALFLGMLFLITFIHARNSLETSINVALRHAVTRGDLVRMEGEIVPDINRWKENGGTYSTAEKYFITEGEDIQKYNAWISEVFVGQKLSDMPEQFLYALAYVNDTMRQSLGASVRFPCDPNKDNGWGCLKCFPVNPKAYFLSASGGTTQPDTPIPSEELEETLRIYRGVGITCEYSPTRAILAPLNAVSEFIAGSIRQKYLLRSTKFFSAYNSHFLLGHTFNPATEYVYSE